jgi:sterol desaturase/sphingolipid hydroxylase (fatty acid hydroxylase superfamily)
MFSYLHDRVHLRNFWMTRVPLLKAWFVQARRLHDIHHRSLNDHGRMDRNFGIGLFLFDRLFRTISKCIALSIAPAIAWPSCVTT